MVKQVQDTPGAPPPSSPPSAGKKPKEAWKVKDLKEPKKPPTVFFLFFHSLKAEVLSLFLLILYTLSNQVMESKPEMSYKEAMAELGRVWNGFSDNDKSPFLVRHKQLMDEWYQARETFRAEKDESLGRGRKVKDPLKPKKPLGVFFLFFHSVKDEVLDID